MHFSGLVLDSSYMYIKFYAVCGFFFTCEKWPADEGENYESGKSDEIML